MFSYSAVLILLPSIGRRKKKKTVNGTSSILDKGDKIIYELYNPVVGTSLQITSVTGNKTTYL